MTETERKPATSMAREIAEIPGLAAQLLARQGDVGVIAARIRQAAPRIVIVCGRGSSGHVGVYFRYLIEARTGIIVSASAPSVFTAYRRRPDMGNALFVVISQSGRSPDLVMATEYAHQSGALTLAIVNDATSPVAAAADLVLPIGAGPERAVAATKTVVLSMQAGIQLVTALTGDADLRDSLHRLPGRLANVIACDWSAWGLSLAAAPAAFVAARGYGFGIAREIALKVTEILRLPALGFSAAELRHGPRAAITAATPVLLLRQNDEAGATVDGLFNDLRSAGETVFSAGGPASTLPWIGDDHPICDAVAMLLPPYAAIESEARRRGLDPDNPQHLSKVTRTL
jgi:glucosamine--fructose-6-phosphate aminotransferase (isomerizing)